MTVPVPHLARAAVFMEEGRMEEAQALLLRHTRGKVHPHTYYLLSIIHETLGQLDQAVYFAQRAAAADPTDAALASGEAQRLFMAEKHAESLARLEAFSATRPSDASILSTRIAMLSKFDREEEALRLVESLPARLRNSPSITGALVSVFIKTGRLEEAIAMSDRGATVFGRVNALMAGGSIPAAAEALRAICEKFPDDDGGWTFYASALNYVQDSALAESVRAHRGYAAAARKRHGEANTSWNVSPDPDRKLRVGIVSPDLRRHAVACFLAPLLENYSRSEWHLTAYHVHMKQDDVSARLRSLVDAWRWMPVPHTPFLVRRILQDRIDVLIDLSGHTEGHRLSVFQKKPAPVQASYLGYPNTTGLDSVDLRIIDSITDPPGSEQWAVERLVRIDPCFLCFKPMENVPSLAPSSRANDHVSFGSFNHPMKVSPATLQMWGRLLAAVPGSTMVLKHAVLTKEWMRQRLAARLAGAGIDPARVSILPPAPSYADHLATYSNIDIGLDTYPYHGTTTTCEAMWMGVPVITLRGDRHAARVGCSLLSAVGLADLIASDPDDFVAIGTRLAADRERLAAWRTAGPISLREQMLRSPLCDARSFSARFQAAIRDAWRAWCAGRRGRAGVPASR